MFVQASNQSQGKLVDDLSLAQFGLLVRVLSHPSTKRDFRSLLMSSNLQGIFNQSNEFILTKVSRLNFKGLGESQAKEQVQNRLLYRVKEASVEQMARDDLCQAPPLPGRREGARHGTGTP